LPNRDSLLEVVGERMRHLAQLCEEAGARSAEFTPRYPRLSLGLTSVSRRSPTHLGERHGTHVVTAERRVSRVQVRGLGRIHQHVRAERPGPQSRGGSTLGAEEELAVLGGAHGTGICNAVRCEGEAEAAVGTLLDPRASVEYDPSDGIRLLRLRVHVHVAPSEHAPAFLPLATRLPDS